MYFKNNFNQMKKKHIYQNLWKASKAILREKSMELNTQKKGMFQVNYLSFPYNELEKNKS